MLNFKETLNIKELSDVTGNVPLNKNQLKAIENIKYCAADKWVYVYGWHNDGYDNYRSFLLSPLTLFDTIYKDSTHYIYGDGYVDVCKSVKDKNKLRDIRSCGKDFLEKIVLFYTVDLIEETFNEIRGTVEDEYRIENELKIMKSRLGL